MSRSPLLIGVAALTLPLLSADLLTEGYDLAPKFTEGQNLTVHNEFTVTFGLDDASAQMGGSEMLPEVPTVDVEVEGVQEYSESILAAADGQITKMRRTHDQENFQVSGEAGMQGQFQNIDESQDGPLVGHTIELTRNDEDGWDAEDVTEDADPLDDAGELAMKMANDQTHGEPFLPDHPVEVGGTWDVGTEMLETMQRAMAANNDDPDMGKMMGLLDSLKDSIEYDATGKLVSVEGDKANIEWKMTASLSIDDLFGMLREVVDPDEMGGLPESAEGSLEIEMELTGTGVFDLDSHQLSEASFEGEFALSGDFSMSEQGMDIQANAEASGTFEMTTAVTVE